MTKTKWFFILFMVACAGVSLVFAQRYYNRRSSPRRGVPDWESDKEFSNDVFTFVRIRYSSGYGGRDYRGGGRGYRGGSWATDYPDSDLNFSFRLHQLTSMEVNPDGLVLELTDPKLFN
ncbi:MAG: DUF4159 domain-containing protein, partial [Planctomycetota bacterium]